MNPRDHERHYCGFDSRKEAARQRAAWLSSLRERANRRARN